MAKAEKQCAFRKVYLELDDEDQESVANAINKGVGSYVIAGALAEGGYRIAHSTVSLHLHGRCRCV